MMKVLWNDFLQLFFPPYCHSCHKELVGGEIGICVSCMSDLPRTYATGPFNSAEQRLWGRFPFEKGTSFCYYVKKGRFARLIIDAKYGGQPYVNYYLAMIFAQELMADGWPEGIDCIIPVPVHRRRKWKRGYNQTEEIAKALSECWHIPVEKTVLVKRKYTNSQVRLRFQERFANIAGTFMCRHGERVVGKHVLIVDDVLTSGATIEACAQVLLQNKDVKISFLTLGLTI